MVRRVNKGSLSRGEEGQALTEYLILLSMSVAVVMMVTRFIGKANLTKRLLDPLRGSYAAMYRYGHPQGKGYDDGGPENHPRAAQSAGFRGFVNPKK